MRKHIAPIIGIILLVLLLGCVVASFSERNNNEIITLAYAEVNPIEGTIVGEMAKAFKWKVEELSKGMIKIDIQADGVLGSEDQILDHMLGGGNMIDICRVSAHALTQYGCGKSSLLSIPYTFVDEDHFWKFSDSELAEEILIEPHEKGLPLRGLCYGEEGFRHFFFRKEVKDIADLKNKKLRVSADPVMTGMVGNLGAYATTVSFTELYSSLSTGVVDGADQPLSNYKSNAFYEVAPYLLLDGHTLGVMQIMISDVTWNDLNEKQQEWIKEAARYANDICQEKMQTIEAENSKILLEKGAHIIDVKDKTPWVEACQPTIQTYTKNERDLYQQIVDIQYKGEQIENNLENSEKDGK